MTHLHIDKICREKKRDVLFLRFEELPPVCNGIDTTRLCWNSSCADVVAADAVKVPTPLDLIRDDNEPDYQYWGACLDWKIHPSRQQITFWLDKSRIGWCPAFAPANEGLIMRYGGGIYIDVPFDTASPEYQKFTSLLECPDGKMRWPGTKFHFLRLSVALKNAHHDKPGFWQEQAEHF